MLIHFFICKFKRMFAVWISGGGGGRPPLIHTANLKDFLSTFFGPVKNVRKYHHFQFSSAEPWFVFVKERMDSEEKEVLTKENWFNSISLRARRSPRYYILQGWQVILHYTTSTEMVGPMYVLVTRKISAPLRLE